MSVQITYDADNKYNTPIRDIAECRFSRNRDGSFSLAHDDGTEKETARLAEIRELKPKDDAERAALLAEATEIAERAELKLKKAILREIQALAAGDYPIPSASTALGK